MQPLVYTNTAAAVVFVAACLIWAVPETLGATRQTARASRQGATRADRGSQAVLLVLQWSGLALCFVLAGRWPAAAIPWHRTALFVLGVAFMLLGVALRWYAIWTLGRYFTRDVAVSADQPVVQRGPYRLIRHPSYSGTFLTMLGLGLALANWAGLIVLMVLVFAGYTYRVRVEEQALARALGAPYIEYMRRTRRFIPFVF